MPVPTGRPKPFIVAALILVLVPHVVFCADADAQQTALAVEALSRLQGIDLNANPKLKETVLKVLSNKGSPISVGGQQRKRAGAASLFFF